MAECLYIPADYVDEVFPPGRASPDAWIVGAPGDVWWLAPMEKDDAPARLVPGQIVAFAWVEDLGSVRVEIRDDGTHAALDPIPESVTHFTFYTEVIGDTLDDFVAQWRDADLELDEDGRVEVQMARWSADGERYRFEVFSGGARFVPAEDGRALQ